LEEPALTASALGFRLGGAGERRPREQGTSADVDSTAARTRRVAVEGRSRLRVEMVSVAIGTP